jgi:hypothetical protein
MAADPSLVGDTSSSRMLTGVGIALLILATVGAAALLAPRLKEEFREDIFAAPRAEPPVRASATAPVTKAAAAPAPTQPAASPAPTPVAASPVPQGSLGKGEVEVPARPLPLKKATKLKTRPHPPPARRAQPAAAPRAEYVAPAPSTSRPRAESRSYEERRRYEEPRRRVVPPGERWDDPRTWRPGVNHDAPSNVPVPPPPGA